MDHVWELLIAGLLLPLVIIGSVDWPFRKIGINIRGEGYLLFGTQQLHYGHVPVRDFRSYDPARYVWCSLFSKAGKASFTTIRTAMAVAAGLSLSTAGIALTLGGVGLVTTAIALFAISLWLRPGHKQLDNFAAVLCTMALFGLFIAPHSLGFLTLGIAVGLITAIGHNHGLYASVASVMALAIGMSKGWFILDLNGVGLLALGGLLGALIVALPFLYFPGFAKAFWDRKVVTVVKRGTTNLPKPLPWIWTTNPAVLRLQGRFQRVTLKLLFTGMPVILILGIVLPFFDLVPAGPASMLAVCAGSAGLTSFHHTLSNAGRNHFSAPLINALIVFAALSAGHIPLPVSLLVWGSFCVVCVLLNWRELSKPYGYLRSRHLLENIEVLGEQLRAGPQLCADICQIGEAVDKWSAPGSAVVFAPLMPGLYTMFDRQPAMYDVFSVYEATEAAQTKMLAEIKASGAEFALVSTNIVDNNPDRVFLTNFDRVSDLFEREWHELEPIRKYRVFAKSGKADPVMGPT